MPDVKISALPASTTPLAGTEVLPIVQSSTTRQVSVANLTAGRAVSALSIATTTGATFATTSGSVGIGVSSPSVPLQIQAITGGLSMRLNGRASPNDGYSDIGFYNSADTTQHAGIGAATSGMILATNIATPIQFQTNNAEKMRIESGGNVGIGISSVATGIAQRTLQIDAGSGGMILLGGANTQNPNPRIFGGSTYDLNLAAGVTTGKMLFYTNDQNRLEIAANGNVGISVSSPTAIIDVLGTYFNGGSSRTNTATKTFGFRVPHCFTATNPMNVIGGLSTTSVNNVYIGGSDSNIGGTAATDLYFYTAANNTTADGTLRMRIDASGIVTMSAYGAGAATFSASGVISSVSDETWKTKDGVPTNTDAMLQKLEPGYWFYNEEKAPTFGADRQLGFYAQNVHEAIGAEAAPTPEEGKPWGYYDRSVLAVTVMSLKNALNTIEELKQRITALENK